MTTFARIDDGKVLDPRKYATLAEYKASFGGCAEALWSAHTFKEVPDGTQHSAADLTWVAPVMPGAPRLLTRKQFRKHIVAVFGGNGAAAAKLQGIRDLAIAETGTTDAAKRRRLALIMEREEVFTKDEADELMTLFQFAAQDKTDVLAAWPEA